MINKPNMLRLVGSVAETGDDKSAYQQIEKKQDEANADKYIKAKRELNPRLMSGEKKRQAGHLMETAGGTAFIGGIATTMAGTVFSAVAGTFLLPTLAVLIVAGPVIATGGFYLYKKGFQKTLEGFDEKLQVLNEMLDNIERKQKNIKNK